MKRRKLLVVSLFTLIVLGSGLAIKVRSQAATEAPTGFTTPTLSEGPGTQSTGNGFEDAAIFTEDQATFEEADGVDKGLGPLYNARSCADCHQNPVTGGGSQVAEFRVGHNNSKGQFVDPSIKINNGQTIIPNRSLVNDRATCAEAQEHAPASEGIRTFRMSLNVLGDGFVEAIDDATLQQIAQQQPVISGGRIFGQAIQVPLLEASGQTRIGRFGWKDQHASLLSFASDAYLNEQGITNEFNMTDTTSFCKTTADPEDADGDIHHFASFMRGTKAPPADTGLMNSTTGQAGQKLFTQIGCAMCHIPSITTAPAGTSFGGGAFVVPEALGSKVIHPYSDFLLHNVATGDGIVQNGPSNTANKLRTPPLWGLRTRDRLMHDGLSVTAAGAIQRHGGEAGGVIRNYSRLSPSQQSQLLTFLNSL